MHVYHLLCDQLTYSSSKEHMSNSIKWITVIIDFMIVCPLDYPRGYTSQTYEILWCFYRKYLLPLAYVNNNSIFKDV